MTRVIVLLMCLLLVFTSSTIVSADVKEGSVERYYEMVSFYEEVKKLFPEAGIGGYMSYDDFCALSNSEIACSFDSSEVDRVYSKELQNGDQYTLKFYKDGTFSLMSVRGFYGGESWATNSGNTYTVNYIHALATYMVMASFTVNRYISSGVYKLNNYAFAGSSFCTYYSLGYYNGNSSQVAFYGSVVEFNTIIGDYIELAKLRLRAIVDPSSGAFSVDHMYVPYFGY